MENFEEKRGVGPFSAFIIIIVLIILGAVYFWGERVKKNENVAVTPPKEMSQEEKTLKTIGAQSNSDDLSAIENDLSATVIPNTNAEINTDAEFVK